MYIDSNFPKAIIEDNDNYLSVFFNGEPERIRITKDDNETSLILFISQDITIPLSDVNGCTFFVSSLDEMNAIKSGIDVILNLFFKRTSFKNEMSKEPIVVASPELIIASEENNKYLSEKKRTIWKFFKK